MSGVFRPEQNSSITATDDPDLARVFGLTQYDKATGQWTAPRPPDAGQRDGVEVQEQRHADAHAEGEAQREAERQRAEADEAKLEAALTPKKATGAKK